MTFGLCPLESRNNSFTSLSHRENGDIVNAGMERWNLRLLGDFALTANSLPLTSKSDNLRNLLAFLALSKAPVTRKKIAGHIFNQLDDEKQRSGLSLLLTRSQKAFNKLGGMPLFGGSVDQIWLVADNFQLDVREFRQRSAEAAKEGDLVLASRKWQQALDLVEGPPLDNLNLPELAEFRAELYLEILSALEGMARGPLGPETAVHALSIVRRTKLDWQLSTVVVERLINLYGQLRLKGELVELFTNYEDHLNEEFGETPKNDLIALLDRQLKRLDLAKPTAKVHGWTIPAFTIGREQELTELTRLILDTEGPQVLTLTGQSGIGKSHLCRALGTSLSEVGERFDLEILPSDLVAKLAAETGRPYLILDHCEPAHLPLIKRLRQEFPDRKLLIVSHWKTNLPEERLFVLGPLSLAYSKELLVHHVQSISGTGHQVLNSEFVAKLAELCEGIPLGLEIAGRLAGTIGLSACVGTLSQNLAGLANSRESHRKASLQNAIDCSYTFLSPEGQRLVGLLAAFGGLCPIELALEAADLLPTDLEATILAGLVRRSPDRPFIRVSRSTALLVPPSARQVEVGEFAKKAAIWFARKGEETPLDLSVADAVPLALSVCRQMPSEHLLTASLIGTLRPWLGSVTLELSTLEETAATLESYSGQNWGAAALTLNAAFFHLSRYNSMDTIAQRSLQSPSFDGLPADTRIQLFMQAGLAKRALGNLEEGARLYELAVAEADETVAPATLVRCYYNLGLALEVLGQLDKALIAHESAAANFDVDTDPRVETLVNASIGRLRFRQGDLLGASLILEATVNHAAQRDDQRALGETLQNFGSVLYERGLYTRAASAQAAGSLIFLNFGYTSHFRFVTKSSFVCLSASLLAIGEEDLGLKARAMVDRLGDTELYAPDQKTFRKLEARTYPSPAGLKVSLAKESSVRDLLTSCCVTLQRHEGADLIRFVAEKLGPSGDTRASAFLALGS